ncbi:MAG TPA: HAD family hydrolase [Steroidobacteraceae bacterium]
MHAAIFDIDGTLLDSYGFDNSMYADAVRSALGTVHIRDAWEKYACVTDTGVLADICSDNALVYDGLVSAAVMNAYLRLLRSHMEDNGAYQQMPGALQYVNNLRRRADVRVAYATGGCRTTAAYKLAIAGFPLEDIPLASVDDHQDRTRIMLHALGQLGGPFTSVTYFGDGLWDRAAAAQLGWEFVAVGPKLGGLSDFRAVPPNIALQRTGAA